MKSTETVIDIDAPVNQVYRAWADLARLPELLSFVESIEPTDDPDVTRWTVKIGPVERTFDARVAELEPNQRIAWNSITGPDHAGVLTFHHVGERTSRMAVQIEFDPEGVAETVAATLPIIDSALEYDLGQFKAAIEERALKSVT